MERILVTLTSSESKRLIGKGIANLEEVKKAYKNGIVVVATSTTNGFVFEELTGKKIENKGQFTSGIVVPKGLCSTIVEGRGKWMGIDQGKISELTLPELVKLVDRMGPDDIFIKGANAIDVSGAAGIFLGNPDGKSSGGTIGAVIGRVSGRGIKLIIAAGLEKLIPVPVADVAPLVGGPVKYAVGMVSGMMLVKGKLMNEVESFKVLAGVDALPIAGGGVSGAEGCRTFMLSGDAKSIDKAWSLVKSVKGEPPLISKTIECDTCNSACGWKNDTLLVEKRKKS